MYVLRVAKTNMGPFTAGGRALDTQVLAAPWHDVQQHAAMRTEVLCGTLWRWGVGHPSACRSPTHFRVAHPRSSAVVREIRAELHKGATLKRSFFCCLSGLQVPCATARPWACTQSYTLASPEDLMRDLPWKCIPMLALLGSLHTLQ